MSAVFSPATRRRVKLKLAITGAAGSGKTFSSLRLARGLVGPSGRIALIDTENDSSQLYAGLHSFDVCSLRPPYSDGAFVAAIKAAEEAGYDALVIDSASHFWEAILEYKDRLDKRPGTNSFSNWREAGSHFKDVLAAVLQSEMHVICCLRSKVEYVLETNEKGRTVPRKVGMAPVMRDGIDYEFTTVFDLDASHQFSVSKDRSGLFDKRCEVLTEDHGRELLEWLASAPVQEIAPAVPYAASAMDAVTTPREAEPPPPPSPPPHEQHVAMPPPEHAARWKVLVANEDKVNLNIRKWSWVRDDQTFRDLPQDKRNQILERFDAFCKTVGINV